MNQDLVKGVSELMNLAMKLNRPGFHVFVYYSGHIDQLSIRCHPQGWGNGSEHCEKYVYIGGPMAVTPARIQELSRWLELLASGKTSTRKSITNCPSRDKEKYNAYQREYQRKRREAARASASSKG